jgi:hypothetical protein
VNVRVTTSAHRAGMEGSIILVSGAVIAALLVATASTSKTASIACAELNTCPTSALAMIAGAEHVADESTVSRGASQLSDVSRRGVDAYPANPRRQHSRVQRVWNHGIGDADTVRGCRLRSATVGRHGRPIESAAWRRTSSNLSEL